MRLPASGRGGGRRGAHPAGPPGGPGGGRPAPGTTDDGPACTGIIGASSLLWPPP